MGFLDYMEHAFSSVVGNVLSLGSGHGVDKNESFYQPDAGAQRTDVHINAENLELNAAAVNINQAPEVANDNGDAQQTEAQQEAAFNAAMREQDQGQTQGM